MLDTAVKRHLELGNLLKHAEDSLMVCSLGDAEGQRDEPNQDRWDGDGFRDRQDVGVDDGLYAKTGSPCCRAPSILIVRLRTACSEDIGGAVASCQAQWFAKRSLS
jgi:hypothetical protein